MKNDCTTKFSLHHLYISLQKVWRMYFWTWKWKGQPSQTRRPRCWAPKWAKPQKFATSVCMQTPFQPITRSVPCHSRWPRTGRLYGWSCDWRVALWSQHGVTVRRAISAIFVCGRNFYLMLPPRAKLVGRLQLWPFHSQEWSISNFLCSLARNITLHSKENLAFHSLLRRKMMLLPILTTSHVPFLF